MVAVKTTGELVTVLGESINNEEQFSVRRPKMGPNGVEHLDEEFYSFELETPSDHINREAQEQLTRMIAQKEIIQKGMAKYNEGQIDEPELILN